MKLSYLAILALSTFCSMTIYGQNPAKDAAPEPIEITQVKVARDANGDNKVTNTISFSVKSNYKPDTVLDFSLSTMAETLTGTLIKEVSKESAKINSGKFTDKISPKLAIPPGRYYINVMPSLTQKNKAISFSEEDQSRLSVSKFVVIGTIAERLEFMKKEYKIALGYAEELEAIHKEIQKIIDKSKEDKKPPADDPAFQKWQKDALNRAINIDSKITAQLKNQGYITFYPRSLSIFYELAALLQNQLKQFSTEVIMANKNKRTDFPFTISNKVPRLTATIKALMTKETILDLAWAYYALTEDAVVTYETAKDTPEALKNWQAQEAICDDYFSKSDAFIANFQPLTADIWKKNIAKVSESQKTVQEIKTAYGKKINGDKNEALNKRLEELKKNIGVILADVRAALNK